MDSPEDFDYGKFKNDQRSFDKWKSRQQNPIPEQFVQPQEDTIEHDFYGYFTECDDGL